MQTTTTAPPALADTYTVTVDTNITVHTLTLGGAGFTQTVLVPGNNISFGVSADSAIGAHGVLTLGDAGTGYSLFGAGTTGAVTTNGGHLNAVQGGGGIRYLRGNLVNAPGGVIDIAATDTRQDGNNNACDPLCNGPRTSTTNNGAFTVEAAGGFSISGGSSFANAGGSITNNGSFSESSGTFTQRGGTTSGNAVVLSAGTAGLATLDDDTAAGAAHFQVTGSNGTGISLTGTGTNPGLAAGQVMTIAGTDVGVGVLVNFINAGTINLGDGSGTGYSLLGEGQNAALILTNTGHLNFVPGGLRYLRINLISAAGGTVDVAAADTRQDGNNNGSPPNGPVTSSTNNGTFAVEAGAGFAVSGGSSFSNPGTLVNSGSFSMTAGTFTQRGSESGNPVVIADNSTLDDDLGAGGGQFNLMTGFSNGDVLTGTGAQPGIPLGQTVTLTSNDPAHPHDYTVATNFTNAGTIIMGDSSTTGPSVLANANPVTLTNQGRINAVPGGGGNRYLRLNVANAPSGTVDISGTAVVDLSGRSFANQGTLAIEKTGLLAFANGATFTQSANGTFATTIDATANQFGKLDGGSDAINLAGKLKVITVGHPTVGSSWPIISNANRSGMFPNHDFGGWNYDVQYPATGVTLVAQGTCDVWIGGVDNNFGTAANWSLGFVPTSTDDACITATTTTMPPAPADTYTVVVSGGPSVHSLTLGGPNGTQTLVIPANGAQLSLGAASTINATGVLTLGDGGAGNSILCCAGVTLTNNGQFNTVGALGNRYLRVNIANSGGGKVDIAATSSLQDSNTTTTNNGTVTIEPGGGLGVFGPGSFVNSAGTVTNNGAFSMNGNATFIQRGGTESGTPVYLKNGSTLDDDLGAGSAGFFFASGGETLTGTGASPGVAAGQTVTIAAGTGTTATLGVNLTNAGTIVMGDAGSGDSILCCATNTLTNTGHLNTIQGGSGTRYLRVNITNGSAGTIDVAATKTFQSGASAATTTTNNGAVTIEPSGGLGVVGPGSFINSGGSVTNNGAFSMNGNATFMQRSGTESGTPVYLNNGSTLDDDVGAGAAGFIFYSGGETLTGTGASPGVATGQLVTIAAGTGTQINLAVNITNAGTIVMGDTGAGLSALNGPGSLTNTGHLNTIQGGGGTRYLRVNLTNSPSGTIDVAAQNTFQDGANGATTTTNNGTVKVEATGGLGVFGPGSFVNTGGSVTNNGAFSMNGSAVFMQRAGSESGTAVYFTNGSTLDDDVSGGAGLFTFLNSTATLTGTGATPGIGAGQVVTIAAGNGTQATLGANLTNAGTIVMGDAGGGSSILCCAPNILTNTGHLNTIQGGGGNRYIRTNLINAAGGFVDIGGPTPQDVSGLTSTNNATLILKPGRTFSLSNGATFTQGAGGMLQTTVDANATTFGSLTGGSVNLDGQLKVTTVGAPAVGSSWPIISGANRSGQFATRDLDGNNYDVNYSATGVTLVARALARPYHPLPPKRILDTRPQSQVGPYSTPFGPDASRDVAVAGQGDVPATGVSAVVLNVTVTNTTSGSYLTLYPTGVARPLASNLNWVAGNTTPNLVEVALGTGGQVSVYNAYGTVDVIIDVAGYVSTPGVTNVPDGLFNPVVPVRVLDTRIGNGATQAPVGGNQTIDVQVTGVAGSNVPATGVSGVVLNVTVTNATAGSYLTVFPTGGAQPLASNLNFLAGQTVPNRVIVKVGTGAKVSFYNAFGSVDVIADVAGWYTDSTLGGNGSTFTGMTPTRIYDTRSPGLVPVGPNSTISVPVAGLQGIPAMNSLTPPTAVVLNVTVTNPTAGSYLTVWPDGASKPLASDLNCVAGQTVPNLVVVQIGADGTISVYNAYGSTDVVIDVVGYYS